MLHNKYKKSHKIFKKILWSFYKILEKLEIELMQSRLYSYIVIGWKISRSLEFPSHWLSAKLACESTLVVLVQKKLSD